MIGTFSSGRNTMGTPYSTTTTSNIQVNSSNKNVSDPLVIKNVSTSGYGDFNTITSALASITDASPTKKYIISIGPGKYTENITLKSYVYMVFEDNGSILVPANPSLPTITINVAGDYMFRGGKIEGQIYINNADIDLLINNSIFSSIARKQININNCRNLTIKNCIFEYNTTEDDTLEINMIYAIGTFYNKIYISNNIFKITHTGITSPFSLITGTIIPNGQDSLLCIDKNNINYINTNGQTAYCTLCNFTNTTNTNILNNNFDIINNAQAGIFYGYICDGISQIYCTDNVFNIKNFSVNYYGYTKNILSNIIISMDHYFNYINTIGAFGVGTTNAMYIDKFNTLIGGTTTIIDNLQSSGGNTINFATNYLSNLVLVTRYYDFMINNVSKFKIENTKNTSQTLYLPSIFSTTSNFNMTTNIFYINNSTDPLSYVNLYYDNINKCGKINAFDSVLGAVPLNIGVDLYLNTGKILCPTTLTVPDILIDTINEKNAGSGISFANKIKVDNVYEKTLSNNVKFQSPIMVDSIKNLTALGAVTLTSDALNGSAFNILCSGTLTLSQLIGKNLIDYSFLKYANNGGTSNTILGVCNAGINYEQITITPTAIKMNNGLYSSNIYESIVGNGINMNNKTNHNSGIYVNNIYELTLGNGIKMNNKILVDNLYELTPSNGIIMNNNLKVNNIYTQNTTKIKLNDTIELKSSDYPLVNIYVDSNYLGTVENGTQLNPYKTLQAGINALPINQTGIATYTRYVINVAGGNYDEDINIPANRFCNIIQMVAKGSVYLGMPASPGNDFNDAVTDRHFTIFYDTSAWISTTFVRPTLSLLSDKTEDSMSTYNFYAGSGWRISGDILIDTSAPTAYRPCEWHFENVTCGNFGVTGTGTLTGEINMYMYGCKFNFGFVMPFSGTPSATNFSILKCEKCTFMEITAKTLAKMIDSYVYNGITISNNTDTILPYNIMYGCRIGGTFSSVSTSTYYCDLSTKNSSTATLTNVILNSDVRANNIYESTSGNGIVMNNNLKVDNIYEKTSSNGINLNNITHIKNTSTNTNLLDVYNSSLAAGETIGISLGKSATSNNSVYLNFKQHATTSIGSLGLYGFDMIQFDNSKNLNFPYGFRTSGLYKNTGSWISSVIGPDLTNDVVVIGNYTTGNNAIIGAHNTSLTLWSSLYINSYNTSSGGDIIMGSTASTTTFHSIIKLPSYANYSGSTVEGTIVYDYTTHEIKFYNGTAWKSITGYTLSGMMLNDTNTQKIKIPETLNIITNNNHNIPNTTYSYIQTKNKEIVNILKEQKNAFDKAIKIKDDEITELKNQIKQIKDLLLNKSDLSDSVIFV